MEFSTSGTFGHLVHKNWQNIKGVACSHKDFPTNNSILLLHDRHWNNKNSIFTELINELKCKVFFKTLHNLPTGLSTIKYSK